MSLGKWLDRRLIRALTIGGKMAFNCDFNNKIIKIQVEESKPPRLMWYDSLIFKLLIWGAILSAILKAASL